MSGPTIIEVKFENISIKRTWFIFKGPDYSYVGPKIEFQACVAWFPPAGNGTLDEGNCHVSLFVQLEPKTSHVSDDLEIPREFDQGPQKAALRL